MGQVPILLSFTLLLLKKINEVSIMGTPHYQKVYDTQGILRVAQYGQWDGYPSGQGVAILNFLRSVRDTSYLRHLESLEWMQEADWKAIEGYEDWVTKYPHLNRDCGSDIHWLITMGKVQKVDMTEQAEADKWCDGFYTIDFENRTFIAEFRGVMNSYDLESLPSDKQFISDMGHE